MKENTETKPQLLRDPEVFPSKEVLENALGNTYPVFESFMDSITNSEYGLIPEWNYYKDGKAWLCKVCFKKKTVFWLSVWEGYFKTGFFFTEKHVEEIAALNISESIKSDFACSKSIGRLIPMIINIESNEQIRDVLTVIRFKKSLK